MDEQHYWRQFFWAGIGFLWVWPAPTFETVRILETTSTGRALILDRGIFEGLQANDFALFYQKQERPGHLPQYRPVLKAEAIKVGDKISFWLAHESINPEYLGRGERLSMLRLSRHKRKHLKIDQYQIITPAKDPIDIDKKDHQYSFDETSPPQKNEGKKDVKLAHQSTWTESEMGALAQLDFKQVLPPVNKKVIAQSLEADHFDQMTNKTVNKLNNSEDIDEYLSILKTPPAEHLSGLEPRWSRNYNQQQLQDFFVKSGVVEEVFKRQKKAVHEWLGSEINLRYATGFHLPLLSSGDGTFNTNSALAVGYEYHLANINPMLKKWTVELEVEGRSANIIIENYRFSSAEYLFKAWTYYYFHSTPLSIEQYLLYAGLGIQQGIASLTSNSLRNSYNYQISGLPSFRAGIKYKFVNSKIQLFGMNFGANMLLTMAPLRYQNLNRGRLFRGTSTRKFSSTLSIGLSIYL